MKKRYIIVGFLILVLLTVLLFYFNKKSEEGEIKIGVVLSITGKGATYGNWSLTGMQLAVDELNKTATFSSRPIRLIVEDSQSITNKAVSAFNKLIEIDKVSVIVGMVLSDEVLACAPIANNTKTVLFTPGAGSVKIRDAGDYVFRNRESADIQANKLAEYCVNTLGYKSIGIIYSNAANGISYRDSFSEAVKRYGGIVAVKEGFNEGETNFRTQLLNLKKFKINAVYIAGLDSEIGRILKQAREMNYDIQFLASAGAVSEKVIEIAGVSAEGLICSTGSFDTTSTNINVQNFIDNYYKRYNEKPEFVAANSYDAIFMIANIMKTITTGENIKEKLYMVKNFDGVSGNTSFDEYGDVIKPVNLVHLTNNLFIPIRVK